MTAARAIVLVLSVALLSSGHQSPLKVEVVQSSGGCSQLSFSKGQLLYPNCTTGLFVKDLKEEEFYTCEIIPTVTFYGPIDVSLKGTKCPYMGLHFCQDVEENKYLRSEVCNNAISKGNKTASSTIMGVLLATEFILLLIIRHLILKKWVGHTKYSDDLVFTRLEDNSYLLTYYRPSLTKEELKQRGFRKINLFKFMCGKLKKRPIPNKPEEPFERRVATSPAASLYPNLLSLNANELASVQEPVTPKMEQKKYGYKFLTVLLVLLLIPRFTLVESCINVIKAGENVSLVTIQMGDSICSKNGHLSVDKIYHLYSLSQQYTTYPWCLQTDGWHAQSSCPPKESCRSMGITGLVNETIEKGDIPWDNYCSFSNNFLDAQYIRRMHCIWYDSGGVHRNPDDNSLSWAKCRQMRMRVLFDNAKPVDVYSVTNDYIHVRLASAGQVSCKLHLNYYDVYLNNQLTLLIDKCGPHYYICPMPTNSLNPSAGTVGDFQRKGGKTASVDWQKFSCEAGFTFQKCQGPSSFILGGMVGCTKLPGWLDSQYYYMEGNQLMSDSPNKLFSGVLTCPPGEEFIADKKGNCSIIEASLWGSRLAGEQLRFVFKLISSLPGKCMKLRSSCFHHKNCFACDGSIYTLIMNDNNCTDLPTNYTDNSEVFNQISSTYIDYSLTVDPPSTLSHQFSHLFMSPFGLSMIGAHSISIVIIMVFLCLLFKR